MAHDVFISYADPDKPIADAVCSTLEQKGVRCWVAPRDILPGEIWGKAIIEAIHGSSVMVVVFSSKSNESQQVMREVERAVNQGLVIIPFRIEPVLPSENMEYFLSSTHWLDAMTPPLESHIQSLVDTVQKLIERTKPQRPTRQAGGDLVSDVQASRAAEKSKAVESEVRKEIPPPVSPVRPSDGAAGSMPLATVETVARLHRQLVLFVGAQLSLSILQVIVQAGPSAEYSFIGILAFTLINLVVTTAMAVTAYKLAGHLGTGSPALWAVAIFIPVVNILVLLVLSSKARGWCRRYGIEIGLGKGLAELKGDTAVHDSYAVDGVNQSLGGRM